MPRRGTLVRAGDRPAREAVRNGLAGTIDLAGMTTLVPHSAKAAAGDAGAFWPIADCGLLADCNSSALVDRAGSIDWLCLPRYDRDSMLEPVEQLLTA